MADGDQQRQIDERDDRAYRYVRWIAAFGVVVVLLVTTSSAFLRVRAAGLGCPDWPSCYGPAYAATVEAQPVARLLHRVSATLAGACVIAIVLLAASRPRQMRQQLVIAVVLLGLTAWLAVLGRATPTARVPAIALGNVLGGLAMAALFTWLALGRRRGQPASLASRLVSGFALLALVAQIALGVMTSASWSGLACPALPACFISGAIPPMDWKALDPWTLTPGSPVVHMVHRCASVVVALAVTLLAWKLGRRHARLRLVLAVLLLGQLALGVSLILARLPLPVAVAHSVGAALLLLAVIAGLHRLRRG